MPRLGGSSLCPVCSAILPNSRERNAHLAAEHEGYRLAWEGRTATLTAPDGTTRRITMRDFRTMRQQAAGGSPAPVTPEPSDGADAGSSQTPPTGAGEPPTPPAEPRVPRVGRPAERPRSDPVVRAISRQSVEDAFSQAMLADLIRNLSRALSEWDGAGERGVFSVIESTQIASLLYDQTVSVIVRRFAGDVGRFKAAVAMALILAGKGRVHARAIAERQRRVRAGLPPLAEPSNPSAGSVPVTPEPAAEPVILPYPVAAEPRGGVTAEGVQVTPIPAPVMPTPQPVSPDASGGFVPMTPAMIAQRQAEWARSQAPEHEATAQALAGGGIPSALEKVFGE